MTYHTADNRKGVFISEDNLKKLIRANPDAVHLYLCAVLSESSADSDRTDIADGMPENARTAAEAELERLGLFIPDMCHFDAPENQTVRTAKKAEPNYSLDEISKAKLNDIGFASVIEEIEHIIKPELSKSELREILVLYQYYGFSPELLITLTHFIRQRSEVAESGSFSVTLAALVKEARHWYELGITDIAAAEAYSLSEINKWKTVASVETIPGMPSLEAEDRKLVHSWLDLGFSIDSIVYAADISMKRRSEVSVQYINGIIKSWKRAEVFSVDAIAQYEQNKNPATLYAKPNATRRPAKEGRGAQTEQNISAREQEVLNELLKTGE